MSVATYSVELWDHELGDEGGWSGALAREILGGPNEGLGFHAIGRAIRLLHSCGWSETSTYVSREDE